MKTQNNIRDLRNKIDQIDKNIFDLLDKRFSICKEIGKLKLLNKVNIDDPDRENQIIDTINSIMDGRVTKDEIKEVFEPIFNISKKKQKSK
tara:strand:+ start:1377 stop:1649 length:273 start_codon:yes stop_codon:yes gene_type:complete